jgi:hypothetical protein
LVRGGPRPAVFKNILLTTRQPGQADRKTMTSSAAAQGKERDAIGSRIWYRMQERSKGRMGRQDTDLNIIAERMQQVLERDYAYVEWRVLVQPDADAEPWLFVHALTGDFRYGVASVVRGRPCCTRRRTYHNRRK